MIFKVRTVVTLGASHESAWRGREGSAANVLFITYVVVAVMCSLCDNSSGCPILIWSCFCMYVRDSKKDFFFKLAQKITCSSLKIQILEDSWNVQG